MIREESGSWHGEINPPPRRLRFLLLLAATLVLVAGLSLLAGFQLTNGLGLRRLLPIVLPFGLLVAIFATRYFRLAVLALPIAAMAVPFDLSTGTETRIPISMVLTLLLTAIWCVSMSLRGWKLAPSPLNWPLIAFGFLCVLSLVWGIVWRDPGLLDWSGHFIYVQIGALFAILLSLCAAILIGNFVTTVGQLKYLTACFIALLTCMLIVRLLNISQGVFTILGLWGMWLITPAYSLLIAQPGLKWRWRILLLILVGLALYQTMILDKDWLSGWVPSIVAIVAVTLLHSRKAFLVALVVGLIVLYATRGWVEQVAQDNIDDGSLERISIWEQNWQVVRAHWLFGTGPAGYAIYYMNYYRADARSTHNNYMDILAQFGFAGMLAWLWLAAASVWEGWCLVQRAPPGFLRTLAIAAAGGWIGAMSAMFFGDWVLPFAYNVTVAGFKFTVYSWLFLGMLISIRRLLQAQAQLNSGEGLPT